MAHSMNESNELVDELQALKSDVAAKLVAYSDFPKPGILFQWVILYLGFAMQICSFRDIMPLFADMQLVEKLCAAAADNARKITKEVTHRCRSRIFHSTTANYARGRFGGARLSVWTVHRRTPGRAVRART
jgi:hypothetical protein